ncbi:MAG: DNA primase [Bacillota bacterium]|nr:DNA primase [Bacillota bacterium]
MARIPEETIEEIKARNDIVAVVEQYVQLSKRSAKNYFGLCPFHREDTPSFSVSPSKQIFYCFGCNKGGDVVTFIREIEGLSYPEALRLLAERAGIRLPEIDEDAWRAKNRQRRALEAISVEAARYFYHGLQSPDGARARAYLERREILPSTQRVFGLGYAPDRFDGLLGHLRSKGHQESDIRQSGLLLETRTGRWMDLFRGRLIFPIISGLGRGRVIAFGGRILDGPESEGQPKYINSPETPIFVKGRQLFNLNLARRAGRDHLILVEGYMDCISLHQAGLENVIAGLGTALTQEQARLIRQQTEEVVVAYDADAAGRRAVLQNMDTLAAEGLRVRVLSIPDGQDPDDYIRQNGVDRFRALITASLPLLDYKLQAAAEDAGHSRTSPGDIEQLQDSVCQILESIDNQILLEVYLRRAAELLRTPVDAVRRELRQRAAMTERQNRARRQIPSAGPAPAAADEAGGDEPGRELSLTRDEAWLLLLLSLDPGIWAELDPPPETRWFRSGVNAEGRGWIDAVLRLARDRELSRSRLLQEAEGWSLGGRDWPAIFARMLMQLPEGHDDAAWVTEARRRERRVRLDGLQRLRDHYAYQIESGDGAGEEGQKTRDLYRETLAAIRELRALQKTDLVQE